MQDVLEIEVSSSNDYDDFESLGSFVLDDAGELVLASAHTTDTGCEAFLAALDVPGDVMSFDASDMAFKATSDTDADDLLEELFAAHDVAAAEAAAQLIERVAAKAPAAVKTPRAKAPRRARKAKVAKVAAAAPAAPAPMAPITYSIPVFIPPRRARKPRYVSPDQLSLF